MSDPTFSDIDFKYKIALVWTTFNLSFIYEFFSTKILDENIDDFISNLSPDTSDMSDDSDFEFDPCVMDKLVDQCTPEIMLDLDNFEKIYDLVVEQLPPVGKLTAVQLKR